MLKNPPLIVRTIAVTKFIEVPEELLPENDSLTPSYEFVRNANQDMGSDMARLVECAGRNCYDSYGRGRPSSEYSDHVLQVKHGSVLEHANITFFMKGISRGLTHELVRHRVGVAYSQRSTRYVDESESPWIHHPLVMEFLKENPTSSMVSQVRETIDVCKGTYGLVVEKLEEWLTKRGIDKLGARKQARGAARGYLGNALETWMVMTMNLRACRWLIEQRASDFADAEIRGLFTDGCFPHMREHCPEYFSDCEVRPAKDGIGNVVVLNNSKV